MVHLDRRVFVVWSTAAIASTAVVCMPANAKPGKQIAHRATGHNRSPTPVGIPASYGLTAPGVTTPWS